MPSIVPSNEPRVSTDEAKLNKTEAAFLAILRSRGHTVKIHALTFKLAHNTRYTPEFFVVEDGRLVIWEVKGGFIREDAWIKLKTASRLFPEFVFKMAQLDKGQWTETEIPP